jgi:hypothetical protein
MDPERVSVPVSGYESKREGEWSLRFLRTEWSRSLWEAVLERLESHIPAKHPQTFNLAHPGAGGREYFLKIYDSVTRGDAVKDAFRDSKALRAFKMSAALAAEGFHAPVTAAAGERRHYGLLKGAFLLTRALEGDPLPGFLVRRCSAPLSIEGVNAKRRQLRRLASEIRRFHEAGFVHGDLVPTNILVCRNEEELEFVYMDNDRTRRYPPWIRQSFWKRNLVQLNRFCLAGVSLQDRMRFLHVYFEKKTWSKKDAVFMRWLERKTRRRRRECEGIAAAVSFREFMRWNGPFARHPK